MFKISLFIAGISLISFITPVTLAYIAYEFLKIKIRSKIALGYASVLLLLYISCLYFLGINRVSSNSFQYFGLLLLIIWNVPVATTIIIYKLTNWKYHKIIALICASIIPIFSIYEFYNVTFQDANINIDTIEFYINNYLDNDAFYRSEFKYIVGMDFPNSGKIIRKDASFPDLKGDYCSSALIQFSEQDYQRILDYVKNNEKFAGGRIIESKQFNFVLGSKDESAFVYKASYIEEDYYYRFIGFFNDDRTIIIHFIAPQFAVTGV